VEAPLGKKPSFAWQSLQSSTGLVREGLIWRIGNGKTARIWEDRWIGRPSTYMIQSPPTLLDRGATVRHLIDEDLRWWKIPMLQQLFSPKEIELIHKLLISHTNQDDKLIWRGMASGFFSVKSAYHL
jgi:hypothetical protein